MKIVRNAPKFCQMLYILRICDSACTCIRYTRNFGVTSCAVQQCGGPGLMLDCTAAQLARRHKHC
jgi:hypothetical protein